jgi:hypothetical protein
MIDSMSAEAIFSGKLGFSDSRLPVSQFTLPSVATETGRRVKRKATGSRGARKVK